MFSAEQNDKLGAPLDKGNVAKRKNFGGGGELSYIEGWHAIAEANRIFGFEGWDRETTKIALLDTRKYGKEGDEMTSVGYMATVRITVTADGSEVVREGTGFGSGQSKRSEDAHELAVKEAETDAMKRALVTFGNQFGLSLYDKGRTSGASTGTDSTPPKQQQNQPTAKEWATAAASTFKAFTTDRERENWITTNAATLENLRKQAPKLADRLDEIITPDRLGD